MENRFLFIISLFCLVSLVPLYGQLYTDITSTHFPSVRNSMGNSFFDIDGDGDIDLVDTTASYGGTFVYTNDGNGVFTQVTGNAGIPTNGEGHGINPGDFDNDGDGATVSSTAALPEVSDAQWQIKGHFQAMSRGNGIRAGKMVISAPGKDMLILLPGTVMDMLGKPQKD